jgi:hypothetical protein
LLRGRDFSYVTALWIKKLRIRNLKAELLKKAAEKVGNANILVNLVSKRVRQLNSAGGTGRRPLLGDTTGLGVGDIALAELAEDKMDWEALEMAEPETGPAKRRRRSR